MEEKNPNNPVKEYTGVWIPRDVMECDDLSPTEKLAYGEIASFYECYASNAWLAKRLGRSERTARQAVTKLIEFGFVEDVGFNGRFRTVRVAKNCQGGKKLPVRVAKNCQSDWQKNATIDKSIEQSKDTIDTKVSIEAEASGRDDTTTVEKSVEKSEHGNSQINELMSYWEEKCGFPIKTKVQMNRFTCQRLIKSRGVDKIKSAIDVLPATFDDRYAPVIKNFKDLEDKWDALRIYCQRRMARFKTRTIVGDDGLEYTVDASGNITGIKV